ncbi:MAG: DamX protein [Flavobacteriales bacterium]|jgi:DamX protein
MPNKTTAYFTTPSLGGLVQQLGHLVQFGANILVVEGPRHSGKTSLLSYLNHSISSSSEGSSLERVSEINVTDGLGIAQLAGSLCLALALDSAEGASVGESLSIARVYSQNLLREKQLSVVMVDDAHYLDDESLGALASLSLGMGGAAYGLRFVFFAEPGFTARIDSLGLHELAVYDFSMPEFTPSELMRFLGDEGFDPEFIDKHAEHIWNRGKGLPGVALSLAHAILVEQTAKKTGASVRDLARMPLLHVSVLACLLGTLLFLFLYQDSVELSEQPSPEVSKKQTLAKVSSGNVRLSPFEAMAEAEERRVVDTVEPPKDLILSKNRDADEKAVKVKDVNSVASFNHSAETLSIEALVEEPTGLKVNAIEGPVELMGEPSVTSIPERVAIDDVTTTVGPQKVLLSPVELDEAFLTDQSDTAYVLQLLAASQSETLMGYIGAQSNSDQLRMYRRLRPGKSPWFIVVIGPYNDRFEAQKAIRLLPEKQRDAGPWPKSLKAVKGEIAEFSRN